MIIAITGVPGTGKSTLAKLLSKKLGWGLLPANGLVKEKGLWTRKEKGVLVADMGKLARALAVSLRGKRNLILEGHLLCEMKLRVDALVVLRTSPKILRRRLGKRHYPQEKIDENVLAEALDYCTLKAEANYKKIYEIDTTGSIAKSLSRLEKIARGKKTEPAKIDWSQELEEEILLTVK